MKAMILAAGRGERLTPLTAHLPKALLDVNGAPLIGHQVARLRDAGFTEFVVNVAHLGAHIEGYLGNGAEWGVHIAYSREPDGPLETGGGIFRALPLLGPEAFAVVNADVWTDYPFANLPMDPNGLAHLVLVRNPAHHTTGDFALAGGRVILEGPDRHTFAGIAVYRPEMFAECTPGRFPTAPLLRHAAARGLVSGELFPGLWVDVGTHERLALVRGLARPRRAISSEQGTP